MALKSSFNPFWITEYFVFEEKVSISFGFPIHAITKITNFKSLRWAILVTVEAKIVFLDFLELKALRVQKNYITFHIYLRAICGRKERKFDFFLLLPRNSNFTWFLVTFALKQFTYYYKSFVLGDCTLASF